MNNVYLFIAIVLVFSGIILVKRLLGKEGLIGWVGISSILANIFVLKSVNLLGVEATLGNVMFASNFLVTDILTECYGYNEAKKAVKFGIVGVLIFCASTQFSLLFIPNEQDGAQTLFQNMFSFVPRISLASISLFVLSNIVDIKLYEYMRKKQNGRNMWLRNNVCTIVSNCSENFLFYAIAFAGTMPMNVILSCGISATIIEAVIAVCDTPFLYLAKRTEGGEELSLKENIKNG